MSFLLNLFVKNQINSCYTKKGVGVIMEAYYDLRKYFNLIFGENIS